MDAEAARVSQCVRPAPMPTPGWWSIETLARARFMTGFDSPIRSTTGVSMEMNTSGVFL